MANGIATLRKSLQKYQSLSGRNRFVKYDIVTLPNLLTITRLVLIIPILLFIFYWDQRMVALGFFLFGAILDFLDGYIARKQNKITILGELLDPTVDKLFFGSLLISLAYLKELTWWPVLISGSLQIFRWGFGLVLYDQLKQFTHTKAIRYSGQLAIWALTFGIASTFLRLPFSELIVYIGIALFYISTLLLTIGAIKSTLLRRSQHQSVVTKKVLVVEQKEQFSNSI